MCGARARGSPSISVTQGATLVCQVLTGAGWKGSNNGLLCPAGTRRARLPPASCQPRESRFRKAGRGFLGEERGQGLQKSEGPGDLQTEGGCVEEGGSDEKFSRPLHSLTSAAKRVSLPSHIHRGTGSERPPRSQFTLPIWVPKTQGLPVNITPSRPHEHPESL